uniref:Uncharacterized protein n=1 Tax=viral metagenome TaxID=1070528 RepID=A0A6M3K6K2_9ZZZZ
MTGTTNFNGATVDGTTGPDGHVLVIRSTSTLTMTDGGNIQCQGNFTFNSLYDTVMLMGYGGGWVELSRADNV